VSARLRVERTGALATVQDLGRPGHAHLGVGRSGAADRASLRLANRLVGNAEGAAGIEVVLGGFAVRTDHPLLVALTGATCPVRVAGRSRGMYGPVQLADGDRLELGSPTAGLRTYLAVRGGVEVLPVLGSRSTDTMSGLGPDPLSEGDALPVGDEHGAAPGVDLAPQPELPDELVLRVRIGPRDDWFADGEVERLCRTAWQVSSDTDRVGIRLTGETLRRRGDDELKSEAMVRGAIQVPRGGQPIILSADHPVTGGYPVIGVVTPADTDRASQARPGQAVRFRPVG
jgi:biotin-dependent carboxylase-like uncharacterized protein